MGVLHGWRTCPRCATALQRGEGSLDCPGCGSAYYANPAPTASALVTDDRGRLLLARRAFEPFLGCWDTPGGFVEEGEHPLDALRRELLEETALEVEPVSFIGCWMDVYGDAAAAQTTLNLTGRRVSRRGTLAPADDVAELAWFAPDELPDQTTGVAFSETSRLVLADAWRADASTAKGEGPARAGPSSGGGGEKPSTQPTRRARASARSRPSAARRPRRRRARHP